MQFRRILFASQDSYLLYPVILSIPSILGYEKFTFLIERFWTGSSQSRPRGSLDSQALAEMLRKRKRESYADTVFLSTSSTKKDAAIVVHLDDEQDVASKTRKTDFLAHPDKSGPSYTVTVPNDFMSLERSIWHEADMFLFPSAMERIKEHTLPRMVSDGFELLFQSSQHLLMAKREISSLLKGHLTMKQRMEKAESDTKSKGTEAEFYKKSMEDMEVILKKNGEELEEIRKKATKLEESLRREIETLQPSVDAQKNELDLLEAEVTTRVRAKLMYQFLMKKMALWTPQKDIDLYLKYMGSMKDLMDEEDLAATADSSSKVDENAPS
ncbi:uncharacterized protein LOC109133770 [Beta vulgaris subsp. vulgaris]|uniref:uncharacterized protein LOC109133770 n=1 Tax=Beta vulgaris subsp. vulgaris TaxID=3555 RepID=UPI0020367752|nr:uncharacterized protein LOC109133770 [Beta vulgaris subsp. vulgaris]